MKATIDFWVIIIFFLPLTFAQKSSIVNCDTCATIVGIVLDEETMEPLIGASVNLLNTNHGAATDINGFYSIKNIPSGQYSIRASYIAYNTEIKDSIELNSNDTLFIDFELYLGWDMDASEDIKNGKVRILVGGLVAVCAPIEKINNLCKKYGFEYELMGCMFFGGKRYNEQVYKYLDSLNGVDWREQFDKDMDELCNNQ